MPEEKKPAEGTEQPQEQEKPEAAGVTTEEEKAPEKPTEGAQENNAQPPEPVLENPEEKAPDVSEVDTLREENFNLKAQLEAMRTGFLPDIIEDAVVLAENIVKRNGGDISEALKAVAKKYPEWTAAAQSEKKSGFKVGADSSGGTSTDEEKLNTIFGIKKKTGGKN